MPLPTLALGQGAAGGGHVLSFLLGQQVLQANIEEKRRQEGLTLIEALIKDTSRPIEERVSFLPHVKEAYPMLSKLVGAIEKNPTLLQTITPEEAATRRTQERTAGRETSLATAAAGWQGPGQQVEGAPEAAAIAAPGAAPGQNIYGQVPSLYEARLITDMKAQHPELTLPEIRTGLEQLGKISTPKQKEDFARYLGENLKDPKSAAGAATFAEMFLGPGIIPASLERGSMLATFKFIADMPLEIRREAARNLRAQSKGNPTMELLAQGIEKPSVRETMQETLDQMRQVSFKTLRDGSATDEQRKQAFADLKLADNLGISLAMPKEMAEVAIAREQATAQKVLWEKQGKVAEKQIDLAQKQLEQIPIHARIEQQQYALNLLKEQGVLSHNATLSIVNSIGGLNQAESALFADRVKLDTSILGAIPSLKPQLEKDRASIDRSLTAIDATRKGFFTEAKQQTRIGLSIQASVAKETSKLTGVDTAEVLGTVEEVIRLGKAAADNEEAGDYADTQKVQGLTLEDALAKLEKVSGWSVSKKALYEEYLRSKLKPKPVAPPPPAPLLSEAAEGTPGKPSEFILY